MATVILEIPDDRHEELKRRAEAEGLSVSELLLRELGCVAPRIAHEELSKRLKGRSRIDIGMSGAESRSRRTRRADAVSRRAV